MRRRPIFALREAIELSRDLQLILLSNFLWSSGSMLYYFLWPIYVRDLGGTAREIGLLTSLMFLTSALTLIPGGWLADRLERKRLLLVTWVVATPAPLVYALARSWVGLIPGVVIYSFFLGWPAFEAYIAHAAPSERLSRAFALTSAGFSLGAVLSPLAGAALLPSLGIRGLFLISFGLFAASTATLFLISPQPPPRSRSSERGPAGSYLQGLLSALRDRRLGRWWAAFALAALGASAARPFIPAFLEDGYRFSRPAILMASALLALGEVVIAVGLGWVGDRWWRSGALGLSFLCVVLGLGLLLFGGAPGALLAMFLLGGDRVSISLSRALIGSYAPVGTSGALFALYWVIVDGAGAGGPYLGGMLYDSSPPRLFLGASGLVLAALALVVLPRRGGRELVRPSVEASRPEVKEAR